MSNIMLLACKSQSNFDLTKVKLNEDKISDLISSEIKTATYNAGVSEGEYKYTSTGSDKILIFNNVNFSGENPDASYENKVTFYFNKKDSIINRYQLETLVTEQSNKLIEVLREKLGEPNYTGFSDEKNKQDSYPSEFIWEDIKNGLLYHISYTKQHYGMDSNLNVMPIAENYPALPGITYWEDFIIERKKRGNPNYTYQQFIIDETEHDPENVYNTYTK